MANLVGMVYVHVSDAEEGELTVWYSSDASEGVIEASSYSILCAPSAQYCVTILITQDDENIFHADRDDYAYIHIMDAAGLVVTKYVDLDSWGVSVEAKPSGATVDSGEA